MTARREEIVQAWINRHRAERKPADSPGMTFAQAMDVLREELRAVRPGLPGQGIVIRWGRPYLTVSGELYEYWPSSDDRHANWTVEFPTRRGYCRVTYRQNGDAR